MDETLSLTLSHGDSYIPVFESGSVVASRYNTHVYNIDII